ncbi:MAG: hypothetical protein ACOZCO_01435 [Bacteroidota bacterium]
MAGNNYSYTEIGELESDFQEDIEKISWRVDGKVSEVLRPVGSSKKNLKFEYDAMGQRVAKHIYSSSNNWEKSTFYVRDAQGNVISVYEETNPVTPSYKLIEQHIYGSSRLGMNTQEKEMIATTIIPNQHQRELGKKQFELTNHLGNVLTVITDKKIPIESTTITGEVEYFITEIVSVNDYSPFGVLLTDRDFSSEKYRYSFQSQERDDELKGNGNSINYTFRMHDPRLGRFFTVDPMYMKYPYNSTYAFSENRVIDGVELEGLEVATIENKTIGMYAFVQINFVGGSYFGGKGIGFYWGAGGGLGLGAGVVNTTTVTVHATDIATFKACSNNISAGFFYAKPVGMKASATLSFSDDFKKGYMNYSTSFKTFGLGGGGYIEYTRTFTYDEVVSWKDLAFELNAAFGGDEVFTAQSLFELAKENATAAIKSDIAMIKNTIDTYEKGIEILNSNIEETQSALDNYVNDGGKNQSLIEKFAKTINEAQQKVLDYKSKIEEKNTELKSAEAALEVVEKMTIEE